MSMLSVLGWFCTLALGFTLAIAIVTAGAGAFVALLVWAVDFAERRARRQP